MAEIVNLNRRRKAARREEEAQAAQENRVRFGRTKGEKARDELLAEQRERRLDNARKDPPDHA